ncbi:MAG: response regulator transcription factor [Ardenticatenaceae bacterium]|nr:response regulator transcription factor [Ardenticatenaceae bacterium]
MLVFIVSEDAEDRELCHQALRLGGYQAAVYKEIDSALLAAEEQTINLLIYWAPPTASVQEICKTVSQIRDWMIVPVVLVVEDPTETDHCAYLDQGVDLVFKRPVSLRVLRRYAGNLIRRTNNISMAALIPIETKSISLDPGSHSVTVSGQPPQHLTQLEFRLLYVLMVNSGQVISTGDLVELVWGYSGEGNKDLVRGLIRRLRRKIEPAGEKPRFIHNLPGVGYRFSS